MNSIDTVGAVTNAASSKAKHGPQIQDLTGLDQTLGLNWFALTPDLQSQSSGSSFAALFAGATTSTPSAPNSDPTAQLTALVQSGTPISTIIDRLSQQIAAAVQQQLSASNGSGAGGQLQSSLAATIAKALAPPGNAPPGTASQQVTALATRLQQWIAQLAGEAQSATQGQQNDISGNLLDAKSAKDIPAQRKPNPPSATVDPALLAQALLGATAASLNASAPHIAKAPTTTVGTQGNNGFVPATASSTEPPAASSAQTAVTPAIAMSNAPDLLARMLVRAAGVDAAINGAAAQGRQPATTSSSGNAGAPATLAARFATALASAVTQATSSDANPNATGSGNGHDLSQRQSNQTPTSPTMFGGSVVASAPLTNAAVPQQAHSPQTPFVDADAVVEQVVKSMVMRTDQSGTSEVRLQLNPDNLGAVTMKLTISGSSVSANVVAQNAEVGNALSSNHQQLAKSLSDAGLTLAAFSVDVSGGDAGRQQNRDRTGGFGRRYVVHEIGDGSDESEAATPTGGGPQLLPGSSLELFNYLA